jgi:hypothetical protein
MKQKLPDDPMRGRYISTFRTEAGEAVLDDLMTRFHIFDEIWCGENSHDAAYCEGQRSVVIHILKALQPQAETPEDAQRRRRESYLDTGPLDVELGLDGS